MVSKSLPIDFSANSNWLIFSRIFVNARNVKQFVRFDEPVKALYIKLESLETVEPNNRVVVGEIGVLTK